VSFQGWNLLHWNELARFRGKGTKDGKKHLSLLDEAANLRHTSSAAKNRHHRAKKEWFDCLRALAHRNLS